ncbi:MAGUK p55 subfamily member 6b isoform X2 [Anarhichas minor]|uniref:MAGUK p55 subfamily member 6b isoform X2 n=2 Tax=Anarhichas minor TaxID=65739 RepID=UPI003F7396A2
MVTAMEDACPNGVREEEEEEVTPPGQLGVEGPPAVQSTQEADTSGAMLQVLDNLGELPTSTAAKDIDLLFLRGIMESPTAHEQLEEVKLEAVQDNNVELVTDILGDINNLQLKDDSAAELSRILKEPHFQSLLEAHDMVASKCYEVPPPTEMTNDAAVNNALMQADAVRMIGIRKKAGEPLGVTFRVEKDDLVIARILHGGMIDRQGLLHVGDIIKEVNGKDVGNNPTELQEMLKDCSGGITLKILPSYRDAPAPPQVYVRPYFDYNPANDNLIPCREAGMSFKKADILQIVNREDPNWWQACHVVAGATGLIPSQFLEEKRKAFVPRDFDGSGILCGTIAGKKKKKMMYLTAKNAEFDRHELQIYEEVAKVPAFQRKTLVLIGAQGVGRRSLKNRLMVLQPTRFGTTMPYTSRRPRDDELDGNSYHFTSRTEMEVDVKAGRFLEHGEYDGNLYGTKIESIHEVVGTGRTCILDVNPQALKVLKTAEFMPYVVFIAAPDFDTLKAMHAAVVDAGITTKQLTDVDLRKTVDESARIQRAYSHYFDLTIVNDNLDKAFETLHAGVDKLCSEPQWVPVNWVY